MSSLAYLSMNVQLCVSVACVCVCWRLRAGVRVWQQRMQAAFLLYVQRMLTLGTKKLHSRYKEC
jgi:hypothetical protein